MESPSINAPDRLLELARQVAAATGEWNTRPDLDPLTAFLAEVRTALGMDVAFVSRFHGGSRIVEAVNVSPGVPIPIAAGNRDDLEESYCHRIVTEGLDTVMRDTADYPSIASLEVTSRLQIRSYITATVVLRSGFVFGTLCCFSRHTRADLRAVDAAALQAVADAIALDLDRHGRLSQRIWQWGGVRPAAHA
jgi:GAF domain-containing protein